MYNGMFTVCDYDAKMLEGKQGTADVNKEYLILKGNIGIHHPTDGDPLDDGSETSYVYWSKRLDDHSTLHFCSAECLGGYAEAKKFLVKEMRERKKVNSDDSHWGNY